MPRRRPERKIRPPQISWACGIILIKIIDSYCTCENGKKLIPALNPTNRLELLDGARRDCDLGSDLVPGFPCKACLGSFIYYLQSLGPSGPSRGRGSPRDAYGLWRDFVSSSGQG